MYQLLNLLLWFEELLVWEKKIWSSVSVSAFRGGELFPDFAAAISYPYKIFVEFCLGDLELCCFLAPIFQGNLICLLFMHLLFLGLHSYSMTFLPFFICKLNTMIFFRLFFKSFLDSGKIL